jgi:hypothetical protein
MVPVMSNAKSIHSAIDRPISKHRDTSSVCDPMFSFLNMFLR